MKTFESLTTAQRDLYLTIRNDRQSMAVVDWLHSCAAKTHTPSADRLANCSTLRALLRRVSAKLGAEYGEHITTADRAAVAQVITSDIMQAI